MLSTYLNTTVSEQQRRKRELRNRQTAQPVTVCGVPAYENPTAALITTMGGQIHVQPLNSPSLYTHGSDCVKHGIEEQCMNVAYLITRSRSRVTSPTKLKKTPQEYSIAFCTKKLCCARRLSTHSVYTPANADTNTPTRTSKTPVARPDDEPVASWEMISGLLLCVVRTPENRSASAHHFKLVSGLFSKIRNRIAVMGIFNCHNCQTTRHVEGGKGLRHRVCASTYQHMRGGIQVDEDVVEQVVVDHVERRRNSIPQRLSKKRSNTQRLNSAASIGPGGNRVKTNKWQSGDARHTTTYASFRWRRATTTATTKHTHSLRSSTNSVSANALYGG